jgi:hypothetical protein
MPSFTSPTVSPKAKTGKPNRPLRTAESRHPFGEKNHDPHRFGSESIPSHATRKANTNPKDGFHCCPAQAPAGRLAQRSKNDVHRCASGKEVGRSEAGHDANTEGSKGTRK